MTIKEMEQMVGITKANIRFYEREGLLSPARTDNNYRSYTQEDQEILEKIKYLRMLGISVSDIKRFERGETSCYELLDRRAKQLEEEEEILHRFRDLCLEIKQRDWDFQSFDTELLAIKLEFLKTKGTERMRTDKQSFWVRVKNVVWFLAMCGIVSLLFFPINEILRIPIPGAVIAVWTSAVTILAMLSLVSQGIVSKDESGESRWQKQRKTMERSARNRNCRYEKQVEGLNQICLASLVIIPINRILEIQWPIWLTIFWFVAVFGSSIAVAVVKN